MFKKKSNAPSTKLTAPIEKLQKNADKVQKNIFDVEQNFNKDVSKINEGKQPLYQEDTNKRILNSLELLTGLDEDVVNVKRLQHPQAEMIERDMKQLRHRVMELREDHDHIYHLSRTKGRPSINWGNMMDEKLDKLKSMGFGQDLPSVEDEVEEHNIFHSEVESLAPHISSSGDKKYVSSLQMKYNKLLASSSARQRNLLSLRDYMQRCVNELYWMDQQVEERINYDWSDTNLDYAARQRQYENFISECLESKEATVSKLNDDGEKLVAAEHPGTNVIEAHMEAVHADWKEYLNLLICEENHLKHMDEYNKYHKEARDSQDLLKRLETELNQKYNPEFKDVYQMEGLIRGMDDQAKAIDHFDERVKALQMRSLQILPLKYRRKTPQKLLPIEALCEFDTAEGQILRGERYTLLRNNGTKWDVKDAAGRKITAPAVCFMIPPTDPEAVGTSDNLASQQKAIKQKMATSKRALLKRFEELKKKSGTGTGTEIMDKSKSVHASGNSVVTARELTNVNAKSLNMEVKTVAPPGPSGNVEQAPQADLTALGASVIFADKMSGVNIGGDMNLSVTTTIVPAASPSRTLDETPPSSKGPAAKMITEQKVKLIECLMADHSLILQHVHAKEIVTDRQYQELKHISQPGKTVTDLIDHIIFKDEDSCSRFIEVLKEPEVVETYPQLRQITKNWC